MLDQPSATVVQTLVDRVISECSSKLKIKAVLLQAYHHALHNRYFAAKDLLM